MTNKKYKYFDSDNFFPGIPDPIRDKMTWPERIFCLAVTLIGADMLLTLVLWALES